MGQYQIKALYITKKLYQGFSPEPPELILAWDGYSAAEDAEGFDLACKTALNTVGHDLDQSWIVTIYVDRDAIDRLFEPLSLVEGIVGK